MPEETQYEDHIPESDQIMEPADSRGDKDELLVGASGRADFRGMSVEEDDDVGVYEGERDSLPPDYKYRVSTAVSDEYGVYPAPGETDLPLGYTTDEHLAEEEGLSYFPPDDPPIVADGDAPEGVRIETGYGASALDAGYSEEETPARLRENDDDLAEDIVDALRMSSIASGFRIRVKVREGVAYLGGDVSSFDDIARIGEVVMSVPGVEDVDDENRDISDGNIEGVRRVISDQASNDGDLE
ncbi:MAG: BON domain-containing protein [Anaerolineae bacterium]